MSKSNNCDSLLRRSDNVTLPGGIVIAMVTDNLDTASRLSLISDRTKSGDQLSWGGPPKSLAHFAIESGGPKCEGLSHSMHSLAQPKVLAGAGLAALITSPACYPRLVLWSASPAPLLFSSAPVLTVFFELFVKGSLTFDVFGSVLSSPHHKGGLMTM